MLLRRVCPTSESSGGPPTMNGAIPEFHMMDPLLQDHAFQQQLIQVNRLAFGLGSVEFTQFSVHFICKCAKELESEFQIT